MEQLVIVLGMAVAVSFGVVLLALVLRAAIVNSRVPAKAKIVNPAEAIQEPLSCDRSDLAHAIRGYDTPELFREDSIARQQQNNEESLN
jgi:hypothetical protein